MFLTKDGKTKLGDLNVSKIAKKGLLYTQTGTPYYASPEVWKDMPYDTKSDIWSLGCVVYEAACLKPPFRAQSMEALNQRVQKGSKKRDMNRCISKDTEYIFRRAWSVVKYSAPSKF